MGFVALVSDGVSVSIQFIIVSAIVEAQVSYQLDPNVQDIYSNERAVTNRDQYYL